MSIRIENLGKNKIVIHTSPHSVLISYDTPVAAFVLGEGYYKTSQFWSITTSRHINSWLDGREAKEKDQEYFDNLLK